MYDGSWKFIENNLCGHWRQKSIMTPPPPRTFHIQSCPTTLALQLITLTANSVNFVAILPDFVAYGWKHWYQKY